MEERGVAEGFVSAGAKVIPNTASLCVCGADAEGPILALPMLGGVIRSGWSVTAGSVYSPELCRYSPGIRSAFTATDWACSVSSSGKDIHE